MQKILIVFALLLTAPGVGSAASLDTPAIDRAAGRTGQLMDGGVYRVAFPRSDLHVMVGNVRVRRVWRSADMPLSFRRVKERSSWAISYCWKTRFSR